MSNNYEISVGVLGFISVFLTSLIIFLSCYLKQLRKHPGGLVIIEYFSILVYNLHFCLIPSIGLYIPAAACEYFSVLFILGYFLTWNYNTCLSIEVFLKLKQMTNTSYSRRRKIYHSLSCGSSIILTILIGSLESLGRTSYKSCFVKKDTNGHYLELFPLVLNFPVILTCSILSIKNATKSFEPLMVGLAISNLLVACTLALSNLFSFIDLYRPIPASQMDITACIGACSGIVLSGSRLISKSLYSKVRKAMITSLKRGSLREMQIDEIHDESSEINFYKSNIWDLSMLFDNLTKKTVAEILVTLFIRFKYEKNRTSDEKFVISYSSERYSELSNIVPYVNNLHKDNSVIIEYLPNAFQNIREMVGVSDFNICQSFIDCRNFRGIKVEETNDGGKSGSFFFRTSDGNFIIKTVKKDERKTFTKKIIENYINHIRNKESKLVRILGVYKIYPSKVGFIIMESIIPDIQDFFAYDLKGYINNNRTSQTNTKKDSEFIEKFRGIDLKAKNELIYHLREDLRLLNELDLMDYSVLLVDCPFAVDVKSRYLLKFESRTVFVGIIDFFQEFNLKKNAEYHIKKLFGREEISCIHPTDYYTRLLNFLIRYL